MTEIIALSFFIVLFSAFLTPASAANVHEGEKLARRWCAGCHVVSADQTKAMTEAPPFSSIANKPRFDAERLALFLQHPHPVMPDMSLTRDEAANLAAYIKSQGSNKHD
jgi:mono/diheme cytochrome c family protein